MEMFIRFVSKITAVQILQIDLKMYHTLYMYTHNYGTQPRLDKISNVEARQNHIIFLVHPLLIPILPLKPPGRVPLSY